MNRLTPILIIALFIGSFYIPITAGAGELDAVQRAKVLLRVLTYDRNLTSRLDGNNVVVKILFNPKNSASRSEKKAIVRAFTSLKSVSIKGNNLQVSEIAFSSAGDLKAVLSGGKVAAVYVCAGLESKLSGIRSATRSAKVASISGFEEMVRKGLSIAAVEVDGKGKIIVNLRSAKAEGMKLESSVLRLADVIR